MAKQKNHIKGFSERLQQYAEDRSLDFHQYSPYHMRIMDGGYVVLDTWTTGRYYIVMTDYYKLTDGSIVERQGEKGDLPIDNLWSFLDTIFYGADMAEHTNIKEK
jgi:hypothetical protein